MSDILLNESEYLTLGAAARWVETVTPTLPNHDTTLSAAYRVAKAICAGEIAAYGRPGYGGAGEGSRLFADYADHERIPRYRIAEVGIWSFDFETNRLSCPPGWADPDKLTYSRWQYIDLRTPVAEWRRYLLRGELGEPASAGDASDGLPTAELLEASPPAPSTESVTDVTAGDSSTEPPAKSPASKVKHAGGAPPTYDREVILRLSVDYVTSHGWPGTQDKMIEVMQQLCRDNMRQVCCGNKLKEPSEATLRPIAKRVHCNWRERKNSPN